jgi:hypothetical protein
MTTAIILPPSTDLDTNVLRFNASILAGQLAP